MPVSEVDGVNKSNVRIWKNKSIIILLAGPQLKNLKTADHDLGIVTTKVKSFYFMFCSWIRQDKIKEDSSIWEAIKSQKTHKSITQHSTCTKKDLRSHI